MEFGYIEKTEVKLYPRVMNVGDTINGRGTFNSYIRCKAIFETFFKKFVLCPVKYRKQCEKVEIAIEKAKSLMQGN